MTMERRWSDELEYEMVVRDFVDVLNDGEDREIAAFLDDDVVFRLSETLAVHGRRRVIDMVKDIRATFGLFRTTLLTVAAVRDVVLSEQRIELCLQPEQNRQLMSFASFRLDGCRISAWHQLHAHG